MQVVIISGKGGTGKTTIASSLAYLSENKIKVDCDVDASNLHLILKGKDLEKHNFIGAKVAKINLDKCTRCLKCMEVCRYDAIKDCKVNEMLCEGCGACKIVCEYDAIELKDEITGQTIITETDKGILSRAEMEAGAEGSGKLVTEVRKNAMKYYKENELVILDGSPGIGCAVMASITGCDIALIVTEPTQSGLEDFMRVLATVKYFGVKPIVCINKFDINTEMSSKIEEFCEGEAIEIVGKIPFDEYANKAINELKPIVAYKDSIAGKEIINMWNKIKKIMEVV
ncbi:ATP-binding protein [Caminicella sporogenes]|uniref:ATP-binding protein n=1 Tax=Caminicella sporogenes TaxID=166485 RepID=UPI0025407C69|nr:ATP-binding protein [Caminicella sporogenes]WIF94198.1 ATP-binding protein [Caminicella sporogenes]